MLWCPYTNTIIFFSPQRYVYPFNRKGIHISCERVCSYLLNSIMCKDARIMSQYLPIMLSCSESRIALLHSKHLLLCWWISKTFNFLLHDPLSLSLKHPPPPSEVQLQAWKSSHFISIEYKSDGENMLLPLYPAKNVNTKKIKPLFFFIKN